MSYIQPQRGTSTGADEPCARHSEAKPPCSDGPHQAATEQGGLSLPAWELQFAVIPRDMLTSRDVPSSAKVIYGVLCGHARTERKDHCWPSYALLVKESGMARQTVSKYLAWLSEHGPEGSDRPWVETWKVHPKGTMWESNVYLLPHLPVYTGRLEENRGFCTTEEIESLSRARPWDSTADKG